MLTGGDAFIKPFLEMIAMKFICLVSKYYVYVSSLRFEPYNICAIWENIVYLQHSFVLI